METGEITGVRLEGEDHCLAGSWASPVSQCVCWTTRGFSVASRKGQPACESPALMLDLQYHLAGASTINSPASSGQSFSHSSIWHPSFRKLCLMSFSRVVLSSRNEQTNIYVEKIGGSGPTWVLPWLVSFHSSPAFGCSSTTSGLCSVLSTCPRLLVDLLVVLDQDSSDNLLTTNNLLYWVKY